MSTNVIKEEIRAKIENAFATVGITVQFIEYTDDIPFDGYHIKHLEMTSKGVTLLNVPLFERIPHASQNQIPRERAFYGTETHRSGLGLVYAYEFFPSLDELLSFIIGPNNAERGILKQTFKSAVIMLPKRIVSKKADFVPNKRLPFGKHSGKTISEIVAEDADYCKWLYAECGRARGIGKQLRNRLGRDIYQELRWNVL